MDAFLHILKAHGLDAQVIITDGSMNLTVPCRADWYGGQLCGD
jgi:hypothetical protein